MIRQIIHIEEEKCNGCGLCAKACHEGAIAMVDGKARLIRDDYCDGMGDCLPNCPTGAITFETREAAPYDAAAVAANQKTDAVRPVFPHSCPGSAIRQMSRPATRASDETMRTQPSQLRNWPVQIKLAPVQAPYWNKARLLIAADCTAYAYANFHMEFIKGRTALIGCPKLDSIDYSEKLTAILKENDIADVTIVRMEVPCCGGLEMAAKKAIQASGKFLPWRVVTISIDGTLLD